MSTETTLLTVNNKVNFNLSELLNPFDLNDIQYCKIQNFDFPVICPKCTSEMSVKNSKRRYIKSEINQKIPFNLKRYYCSKCKNIHTEIPNFVKPYKHYETSTIEHVKSGDIATFGGDNSTIRYWQGKK